MMRGDYLIVSCLRKHIGAFTNVGSVEVYRYNSAKRSTAPFEFVQTITTPTIVSNSYSAATIGMNDDGTRVSFSSRGVTYAGQVVFFELINDKFVYEGVLDGTVTYGYFGESSMYPVSLALASRQSTGPLQMHSAWANALGRQVVIVELTSFF